MKNFLLTLFTVCSVFAQDANLRVYTNIADLKAHGSTKSAVKSALVLGYYEPWDGGGSLLYSTNTVSSTNLGLKFASDIVSTNAWNRLLVPGDFITPEM